MLISRDLITAIFNCSPRDYNANIANMPSQHGGEIGGSLEQRIIYEFNLSHNDTFGELGFGRGKFLMRMKLLYQNNDCFGVECSPYRFGYGVEWWNKIYNFLLENLHGVSGNPSSRRNPSSPHFIEGDFTDVGFWDDFGEFYFQRRGLKLFLNNYGDHMLHDGVMLVLETNLDYYCVSGTVIISLAKMFLCRQSNKWALHKEINVEKIPGDVSWSMGGEITLFVYVKY